MIISLNFSKLLKNSFSILIIAQSVLLIASAIIPMKRVVCRLVSSTPINTAMSHQNRRSKLVIIAL